MLKIFILIFNKLLMIFLKSILKNQEKINVIKVITVIKVVRNQFNIYKDLNLKIIILINKHKIIYNKNTKHN